MPVVPFSPAPAPAELSAPAPDPTFMDMAAAMVKRDRIQKVSDSSSPSDNDTMQKVNDALYGHATGKLNNAQVKKALPSGWSVDLRKGNPNGPYEVLSPEGDYHYIYP